MPSVSQQTSRSKKAPPPALIDGVSQQQIADVVKAHVRKGGGFSAKKSALSFDAGAHGAFTLGQLANKAFDVVHEITKATSMVVVLDGSGYETFADMSDDQQKALIALAAQVLFKANEEATKLMHILELAEVRA